MFSQITFVILSGLILFSTTVFGGQRIDVVDGALSEIFLDEFKPMVGEYSGKMKKMRSLYRSGFLGRKLKLLIPKQRGQFVLKLEDRNRPVLEFIGDTGANLFGGKCDSKIGDLVGLEADFTRSGRIAISKLIFEISVKNCQFKKKHDRKIIGNTISFSFKKKVKKTGENSIEETKMSVFLLRHRVLERECTYWDDNGRCQKEEEWYRKIWHEGTFRKNRELK